ncbi:hypothetical protein C8J57DRAFT_1517415 [Mycena rebaudengoi]|nr:hypothetical protein C8J57DRAFT_1545820 [Mycena rebaudengoi]KAJ7256244.1 hypothetical protein C8J57DRAFT_1517415 [Mycena rebaudengoi]
MPRLRGPPERSEGGEGHQMHPTNFQHQMTKILILRSDESDTRPIHFHPTVILYAAQPAADIRVLAHHDVEAARFAQSLTLLSIPRGSAIPLSPTRAPPPSTTPPIHLVQRVKHTPQLAPGFLRLHATYLHILWPAQRDPRTRNGKDKEWDRSAKTSTAEPLMQNESQRDRASSLASPCTTCARKRPGAGASGNGFPAPTVIFGLLPHHPFAPYTTHTVHSTPTASSSC